MTRYRRQHGAPISDDAGSRPADLWVLIIAVVGAIVALYLTFGGVE